VHFRDSPPAAPAEMRLDIASAATGDPGSFALSPPLLPMAQSHRSAAVKSGQSIC
jgi:hypothetical protein